MQLFRIVAALVLLPWTIPLLAIAVAASIATLAGCELRADKPADCIVAGVQVGPAFDRLMNLSAWPASTATIAILALSMWGVLEVALLAWRRIRRR